MKTMDNTVNHTDLPHPTHLPPATSIACGMFILLLSLSGFIVYLMFIAIVLGRKKFQKNAYFTMAGWLGIADCICLILMITYAAPCILLQRDLSDTRFIGGILNIGWFTGLPLIVFLAVNRFFCICHTDVFKSAFSLRKTRYYCLFSLTFGIAYSIPSFISISPLFFNHDMMSWEWSTKHSGSKVITIGEISLVMLVTITTHVLNFLVFRNIHALQKTSTFQTIQYKRKSIREKKIFIQFFLTTLWLPIFDIPFITLSYVGEPSHWLGFFVTVVYTINCSINGWVYLILNHTVRREFKTMIFSRTPYMMKCVREDTSSNTDGPYEEGMNSTTAFNDPPNGGKRVIYDEQIKPR